MRAWTLVAAVGVLGLLPPGSAEPPALAPTPASTAQAFRRARASGDEAAMAALASEPAVPPILVADALVEPCATAACAGAPVPREPLDDARAWAARVRERPEAQGLEQVVERWAAWDAEAWTLDGRLRAAHDTAVFAVRERLLGVGVAVPVAVAQVHLDAPAPGCVSAVRLALVTAPQAPAQAWAERGLAWARELPSPDLVLDALLTVIEVRQRTQHWSRLLEAAEEALALAASLDRGAGLLGLRMARINALRGTGRYQEALAGLRSLILSPPAPLGSRDRANQAQMEALLTGALGRYDEALAHFERAAALYREAGDRRAPAKMRELASFYLRQRGDMAEARRVLDGAIEEFEAQGEHELALGARASRAEILLHLGARGQALVDVRAALELARRLGRLGEEATWLDALARAALQSRDFAEAKRLYAEVRALYQRMGNRSAAWNAGIHLAGVLGKGGAPEEGLELVDSLRREAGFPASAASARRAAETHALLLGLTEREDEALAALEAIHTQRGADGLALSVPVERARARILLRAGRAQEALDAALAALGSREGQAHGHAPDDIGVLRHLVHADADLALAAATKTFEDAPEADLAEAALRAMELSRARWLAEDLALAPLLAAADVEPGLIERQGIAEQGLRQAQTRLHALAPGTATPEASEVRARLARALEEEREARARIAASQRRLAHFVPEEPPADLAAVAAALPRGTLLLLYHMGEEACHVLAIPGAAAERARLVALPRDGFEKRIDGWLELVATAAAPEANLSRELGRALLDPLAAELREAERVVVSPDRELAFLPFEALRWSDGSGEPRRLIETCEVAYAPSATVLLRLRAQTEGLAPGLGALALGDPVYGTLDPASGAEAPHASWPRLPESSAEARAVAALLPSNETLLCLRAQATLAELDAALGGASHRWRVIHLACHGVYVPDSPGASGLVLGGGEILSPYGALRRRFDADLVTLSACETGRGVVRVGDGVDGLVRALFVAGTPRVMVAGWRIPDEGTRTFMGAFYRAWLDDGLAPAAALRRAKLDALRSADRTHPARWAAFTLWGLPD